MKKIISIMLSVLFIISSVNIVFAENERYSEEKIQEALGILKILDVYPMIIQKILLQIRK